MQNRFQYAFHLMTEYIETLLPKLNIAVIFGGSKKKNGAVMYQTRNPRSWKSYEAVAADIRDSLKRSGFRHVTLMPDDMTLPDALQKEKTHFAWLNTGGVQGYNPVSHTPGILEMMGIPYVGHSPLNACRLDSKHVFKRELASLGIRTPDFLTWFYLTGPLPVKYNKKFDAAFGDYPGPFIVKPVSGRASLHVHLVETRKELPEVVHRVSEVTRNYVLIEKYMPGREFCVAVSGHVRCENGLFSKNEKPFVFSEIERILEPGEAIFTSMDQKAITADRARLIRREDEPDLKKALARLGEEIFTAFDLKSLVRLDVRADEDGVLNVLEVNPKPDLKRAGNAVISLVTIGLGEHGMSYDDLILGLLADRLDYLLRHRNASVSHITELLRQAPSPAAIRWEGIS
ncbi:D-alanyl-alanine synthetase [Desulfonema ishimotonii]|uniref:D-alanyl-alanine synthetase n=1 Tax=Desulfonema ishimotonii TaxID=45657 RepID=A0A401G060_9BACT|nr:D-alanyl-alanine synthetase [Desulfonema ishimotonii]GBC62573.1 D-alanyl-alanine synthetase [Desulfonema ishimotonii]